MIAILSLISIVFLAFLTGDTFRKQYKANTLTTCLSMLVVMLLSLTVGMLCALWVPNMVLATVLAVVVSVALVTVILYKLPIKFFIEAFSTLLMGAMMGTMLIGMATGYELIAVVFFTVLYIISTVVAIGLWNLEEYPRFSKAIPISVIGVATVTLTMLIISGAIIFMDPTTNMPQQHHH